MKEIQILNRQEIIKTGYIPAEMMPNNAEQALRILQVLPKQYYNSLKPRGLSDAAYSFTPLLQKFKEAEGETKTRALMVIIISDLVEFFNVGKRMNDIQVAQTADLVIDNYSWFNIEDFKLCFNYAKSGKFGNLYDRIDGQVIMNWLAMYDDIRTAKIREDNDIEHISLKASERNAPDFLTIHAKRL